MPVPRSLSVTLPITLPGGTTVTVFSGVASVLELVVPSSLTRYTTTVYYSPRVWRDEVGRSGTVQTISVSVHF